MKKKNHQNSGFTLVELVIVLAIFSVTSLLAADVFIGVTKNQRRFTAFQGVESDTRYIMNFITKKVQLGTIDYDFYNDLSLVESTANLKLENGSVHVLAVKNEIDGTIVFRKAGSHDDSWDGTGESLEVCFQKDDINCIEDNDAWESFNANSVVLQKLTFYITPTESPWDRTNDGRYLVNTQPRVTMIYMAKNKDSEDGMQIHIQTTLLTRYYQR